MKKHNLTIVRFAILFAIIIGGFSCVVIKILYIQHVEDELWSKFEQKQIKSDIVIPPKRGNILDENGHILAASLPRYKVYMDTRVEALHLGGDTLFTKYVDSIAIGLSKIVGNKSAQEYKNDMVRAFNQKRYFCICPNVDYIQKKRIESLPLVCKGVYKSGFSYEPNNHRARPYGDLGSRTIGNVLGQAGHGIVGLEKGYEEYLCGTPGLSVRNRIGSSWADVQVSEAENGCDIVTTLDVDLLDICDKSLRQRLEHTRADWGCCILMETSTGEIKAINNLKRTSEGKYQEMENHAVIRIEPGSTFKTIALMAAIEDGEIAMDDTITISKKPWDYKGLDHKDAHKLDTVFTVRNALAISSNIAMAKIITRSYDGSAKKFVQSIERLGVCDSIHNEIPGAHQNKILIPKDEATIAKMAYGYFVEMTPMNILMFYNAIANGGKMVRPYIVKEIRKQGEVIETYDTEVIQSNICSRSTLRDIKGALHDVVWDNALGTASVSKWGNKKAQSKLVSIAGKTGTAQMRDDRGRYSAYNHRMTFVGYFPEEEPMYTCICVIANPKGGYDSGLDCGIVVRNIAEKAIANQGFYEIEDGQLVFKTKR